MHSFWWMIGLTGQVHPLQMGGEERGVSVLGMSTDMLPKSFIGTIDCICVSKYVGRNRWSSN